MKLVVGLGNPGKKYELTRHNAGFQVIDLLVNRWNARATSERVKAQSWSASPAAVGDSVTLLKPQTFMNLSGESVGPLMSFYKLTPSDLVVIHDEVDLPPGELRIKTGGGTGGHNGLKSIDQHLGDFGNGYHRVRIGVGKPPATQVGRDTADWVLGAFEAQEREFMQQVFNQAAEAVEWVLAGKIKEAMNAFHRRGAGEKNGI